MGMEFLKIKKTGINYSALNITDLFIIQVASLCCHTVLQVILKGLMDNLHEF
jgi:hypothetical protein